MVAPDDEYSPAKQPTGIDDVDEHLLPAGQLIHDDDAVVE